MLTKDIAEFINGELIGDGNVEITRVADISKATINEISFIEKDFKPTNASCVIVRENFIENLNCPIIKVKNPKLSFAKIAQILHQNNSKTGWHKSSFIAENSDVRASFIGAFVSVDENTYIGEATQIHDGVRIGKNVSIGKCTIIYPNCVIYDNVSIGNDCVIHAGTVIGADGFGYVRDENEYVKFPQIGKIFIDDNVEIGANCCIDRGALGETRIGKGTKIDNLCQIAHNVQIGQNVVIAALTGISGSSVIEDDVILAGQVGIADHVTIKKGAIIGAKSAVFPNKIVRAGVWCGVPVQPLEDYKRQNASIKKLERLIKNKKL
jgi:UDP-3-O-[3-hydroxymyristoyl] glucosamine N-acyltransferase